jgi:electron-transferring-flavoprotein dehydrogenase
MAMKSGMIAAETIFDLLSKTTDENKTKGKHFTSRSEKKPPCDYIQVLEPSDYDNRVKNSWMWKEFYAVRNFRPSFHTPLGVFGGILYTVFYFLSRGKEPFTLSHGSKFFFD